MYHWMRRSKPQKGNIRIMKIIIRNPIYVSNKGGTINSFLSDTGLLFRVCSKNLCLYCNDILSAKAHLRGLENKTIISGRLLRPISNRYRNALKELVESAAAPYIKRNLTA